MKIKDRSIIMKSYCASKIYKKSVLLFLLALTSAYSVAQQQNTSSYEVQLIPENPDVAGLGKFGDVPVNKYNGTANITVPIHEIDLDGLKIPIVLRYNTSGVRVNQDASWVGLGWSLSEGMSITRELNGYDDTRDIDHVDAQSVGWIFSEDLLLREHPDYTVELDADELYQLHNDFNFNTPQDLEPDVFSVNLQNGSFKFYLPKIVGSETIMNGMVIDEKNYKVVYDINDYSIEVTDLNGFVYSFTETERSTGFNSYGSSNPATPDLVLAGIINPTYQTRKMITSWKVSAITSPNGNTLSFGYDDGFYLSYPHFAEKYELNAYGISNGSFAPEEQEKSVGGSQKLSASLNAFHVKYLSIISGDFGAVKFIKSERVDLFSKQEKIRLAANTPWNPAVTPNDYTAQKLDNIQVVDPDDVIVKSAQFHYSYFNQPWKDDIDEVSYIRLKLDSLNILNQNYQFEYYNPDSLPRKDSKAIDFWGFYNGVANDTRVPSMNRFYMIHPGFILDDEIFERFYKLNGASRKSDIDYGKIGILTRVTYPTGGYTELDYEGNSVTLRSIDYTPTDYVSDGSGQLRASGINSSEAYNYRYQYLKLANDPDYSLFDYNTCKVASESFANNNEFEIFETAFCNNRSYNVKIQATLSCAVGCGQGINPTGPAVWIENINTSQVYNIFYYDGQFSQNTMVELEHEMILPIGEYRFKYSAWSINTPFLVVATATGSLTAWYDASELDQEVYEEFEVGGARVAKVTNYDADGSFINAKKYTYNETIADSSVSSSGKLMDDLVYTSKAYGLFDYTPVLFVADVGGDGAIVWSDNKIRTSPSAAGSHVGYNQVIEEQTDVTGTDKGKITTEYSNTPNRYLYRDKVLMPQLLISGGAQWDYSQTIWDLNSWDYYLVQYDSVFILGAPPITYDFRNGSAVTEKIFNASGNLVKEIANTHVQQTGRYMPNEVYPIMMYLGGQFLHFYTHRIVSTAELGNNYVNKLKTTTTTHYLDGNQISSFTEYFYDNPSHYLLSRTESTDSESALRTSKFYYPQDIQTEPFMSDLISANRLSQRIKSESYKGVTLLFTEHTKYDNTTSTNGLVLPKEVFTYQGTLVEGEENQRVLYERYDTKGHLLQYRRKDNNIPTTLVWSYNTQYPVAKIENATFQQVASALQITETTLMNFNKNNLGTLDALRSVLPNAMVYIYSYDPLVGMTLQTDPNGKSTTYNYDEFNRLKSIEDFQGNVIKAYEYHYK